MSYPPWDNRARMKAKVFEMYEEVEELDQRQMEFSSCGGCVGLPVTFFAVNSRGVQKVPPDSGPLIAFEAPSGFSS